MEWHCVSAPRLRGAQRTPCLTGSHCSTYRNFGNQLGASGSNSSSSPSVKCIVVRLLHIKQSSRRQQTSSPPRNKATRRATQSCHLLPNACESMSLTLEVMSRLTMATAAEPLYNLVHHCVKMWRYPQPGSILHNLIALSLEEERATATGNIHRKLCEIWKSGFWGMRAHRLTNKQTNKQTYRHGDHNTSHPWRGKVITTGT